MLTLRSILIVVVFIMLITIQYSETTIEAQECQRITQSSLSPCRSIQSIELEKVEFNVQAIGDRCYPQLIFHGDFSTLKTKYVAGIINSTQNAPNNFRYTNREFVDYSDSNDAYWTIAFFGYVTTDNFETILDDNSYTLMESRGYTRSELLNNSISEKTHNLTDKYWVKFSLSEAGLGYYVRSNIVGGAEQLLQPENEFRACARELERGIEADASERLRVVQRQAIQTQLEIANADKAFYDSEIIYYQEAIEILKPIISEASRARDEALESLAALQAIYQEHRELIKNYWDDTESAYGDYFNQLIDSTVEANNTVAQINQSIAAVEQMQSDINTLIAHAKTQADEAAKRLEQIGDANE